ncbi:secreted RxLR effector protein 161-like [Hibiscus syriacus]|uniref:secreted RxLR effector protein 161-like n=1 Tax=Hibiscus syriacus TaxID=106335 RepID=UPI00192062E3|nr:secreted RxLR effector protein 161-like [Hibiscus syriacus]
MELIEDAGLGGAKPALTPSQQNLKLITVDFNQGLQQESSDLALEDKPENTFVVQHLSQFMEEPKTSHLEAALRVVRYVKRNHGQGLLCAAERETNTVALCDSEWAPCVMSRRSVTGFNIKLGKSLTSWKSKKQSTIARSSTEAEYRSMTMTVVKIFWLTGLLKELRMKTDPSWDF